MEKNAQDATDFQSTFSPVPTAPANFSWMDEHDDGRNARVGTESIDWLLGKGKAKYTLDYTAERNKNLLNDPYFYNILIGGANAAGGGIDGLSYLPFGVLAKGDNRVLFRHNQEKQIRQAIDDAIASGLHPRVVGHSWGGGTAARLAKDYPDVQFHAFDPVGWFNRVNETPANLTVYRPTGRDYLKFDHPFSILAPIFGGRWPAIGGKGRTVEYDGGHVYGIDRAVNDMVGREWRGKDTRRRRGSITDKGSKGGDMLKSSEYRRGFLMKCAERGIDGQVLLKMAAPNANETNMDRNPGIGPVAPVDRQMAQRRSRTFTGSDGMSYAYANTYPSGVRRLDSGYIPQTSYSVIRYELPKDVAEKTRVRAMDTLSGHTRIRKRHTPGHDDAVPNRNVTDPGLPEDMKRRYYAYNWLRSIRDDYSGGKNFAMHSFWPEGTNAPMHALIGDGKIPRTVLQHETGHAINAGGYESGEDYSNREELEDEIDAHVNGGSIDSELARGALSTYAVPYYLRDNPDMLKRYTDEILSELDPEQHALAREIMADEGYEGTNTAEQVAALNRYKRLVFPDRPLEAVTFDDIQNLATNDHLRTALDSPDVLPMQDAARYAQDRTGRPVIPIDVSRLDDSLFNIDELNRKSFDVYRGTPFFGGTLGSEANAAAAESPYLAGILDYMAKDPEYSGEGYTFDMYPNSDKYLSDLADYMVHKNRQRSAR